MVALSIDGLTVPVAIDSWDVTPREVGASGYSYSGRPLRAERARHKTWRFSTPPQTLSDAYAYAAWCGGLGDLWRWSGTASSNEYASGQYSDKGVAPNTPSAEVYQYRPVKAIGGSALIYDVNGVLEGPSYANSVLSVEPARTNLLITAVRRASDYTAFTAIAGAGTSTLTNQTTTYVQGATSVRFVTTSTNGGIETPETSCAASTTYTASVYVRPNAAETLTIDLRSGTTGSLTSKGTTVVACAAAVWTRLAVTAATAGGDNVLAVRVTAANAETVYTDSWQVEAGAYVTTWADGARNAGKVQYPLSGFRRGATVAFWAKGRAANPTAASYLLVAGPNANTNYLRIYRNTSASDIIVALNGGGTSSTTCTLTWDSAWHHIAVTIDAENRQAKVYIDNVLSQTITLSSSTTPDLTAWTILSPASLAGSAQWEGTIYDLYTLPCVCTASMISALYSGPASGVSPAVRPRAYVSGDLVGLLAPGVRCVGSWVGQESTPGIMSGSWRSGGSTVQIQLDTDEVF